MAAVGGRTLGFTLTLPLHGSQPSWATEPSSLGFRGSRIPPPCPQLPLSRHPPGGSCSPSTDWTQRGQLRWSLLAWGDMRGQRDGGRVAWAGASMPNLSHAGDINMLRPAEGWRGRSAPPPKNRDGDKLHVPKSSQTGQKRKRRKKKREETKQPRREDKTMRRRWPGK